MKEVSISYNIYIEESFNVEIHIKKLIQKIQDLNYLSSIIYLYNEY